MASRLESEDLGDEGYYSNYSDDGTPDPLDEFLERYTIGFDPDLRLKFKKRLENVRVSASLGANGPGLLVSVKPLRCGGWWRKVVLQPAVQGVSVYSRRFRIGNLLDLQLEGHSSAGQRFGVSWRVFPKWSKANNKITAKWRQPMSDQLQFRAHLDVNMGWPELGGQIGGGAAAASMQYDQGYCHVDVPRLELVYDLDARRGGGGSGGSGGGKRRAALGAAGAGMDGGCCSGGGGSSGGAVGDSDEDGDSDGGGSSGGRGSSGGGDGGGGRQRRLTWRALDE